MNGTTGIPWYIMATVTSSALAIVGILIVQNLRTIKSCLRKLDEKTSKQDDRISGFEKTIAACKIDCQRSTVSKEEWIRCESQGRAKLDGVARTLSRIEGKLQVVERLPEICGQIAQKVADSFNDGGKKNGG